MQELNHKKESIPNEITLANHQCAECGYIQKEIKIKFDANPNYSRISKLHPNCDLSKGSLGHIICPKCKTCNDFFMLDSSTKKGNKENIADKI